MVPSRVSGSTRQEWQVVFEPDKVSSGGSDGSGCRVIGEASYTTLRRHAGPLHEPAVSLLQQSARNLLQQGYICSAKSTASDRHAETKVLDWVADTNAGMSTKSDALVQQSTSNRDEQAKAAPPPIDWEFLY